MKLLFDRTGIALAALAALVAGAALSACARKDNSIEPSSTKPDSPVSVAAGASGANPLPGVIPQGEQLPGNTGTGPAHGSTAIGGLTGKQESGGQSTGGRPAPTSGDGGGGSSGTGSK